MTNEIIIKYLFDTGDGNVDDEVRVVDEVFVLSISNVLEESDDSIIGTLSVVFKGSYAPWPSRVIFLNVNDEVMQL